MGELIDPTQHAERRGWARHDCSLSASCRQLGDGTRLARPARLRNISLGGVCLQSSRQYEPAAFLAVEPGSNATVPWETRLVHVLHVRRLENNGDWILGCAFVSQITNQQLRLCCHPRRTAYESPIDSLQACESNGDTDTDPLET